MESGLSNKIHAIALDHARKVKECGLVLAQCVDAWLSGDIDGARKRYDLLVEIEHDADKMKSGLVTLIAEASALGLIEKEKDLSGIILKADSIIDFSEGVGQRLLNCSWRGLPAIVTEKTAALADVIKLAMFLIRDAVFSLNEHPDKVLKLCSEIDDAERKSDVIFRDLQKTLYSDELKDVDLRKILPFLDAMEHLEDIGDIAEQVADSLKIFHVARHGGK